MHNEFHPYTKTLTHTDPEHIPEAWKMTEFKIYQGHKLVPLSISDHILNDLTSLLQSRASERNIYLNSQITFDELSFILKNGVGETETYLPGSAERKRRVYPSAGARYPCETYILITRPIEDIGVGLFHYRPDINSLEQLTIECGDMKDFVVDSSLQTAGVYIFITAIVARSIEKYGTRGYRFCHLEAGAIAQNISLVAQSLGGGSIWIGGTNDYAIERYLDIDGVGEVLLATLAVGTT